MNNLKEPKHPDKFPFEHSHSFSSLAAPKTVLLRKSLKNSEDEYLLTECFNSFILSLTVLLQQIPIRDFSKGI